MRNRCRGVALVEFQIAALLAVLPLIFGVLQVAALLVAHHVLALAGAEAARAGAIGHARDAPMRVALAEGLLPLVTDLTQVDPRGGPLDLVAAGRLRASADVALFARIERLSPTAADFEDHARDWRGVRGIPNDALEWRSSAPGRAGGRSVQAANLLRIRVRYCHRLVVPFIDGILLALLRRLDRDPDGQRCYAAGRVPLRTQATHPMHSEARP